MGEVAAAAAAGTGGKGGACSRAGGRAVAWARAARWRCNGCPAGADAAAKAKPGGVQHRFALTHQVSPLEARRKGRSGRTHQPILDALQDDALSLRGGREPCLEREQLLQAATEAQRRVLVGRRHRSGRRSLARVDALHALRTTHTLHALAWPARRVHLAAKYLSSRDTATPRARHEDRDATRCRRPVSRSDAARGRSVRQLRRCLRRAGGREQDRRRRRRHRCRELRRPPGRGSSPAFLRTRGRAVDRATWATASRTRSSRRGARPARAAP